MRHLVLISDAQTVCGVEGFARQSARYLGPRAQSAALGKPLAPADDLIVNLPVVAWKKRLAAPIIAAAEARTKGRQVTLVLHEWADLALARRLSYLPLLPLATRIFFSAPEIMAQFEATPVSRIVTRNRGVIPIPPNFDVPEWTDSTPLSVSLAADRRSGRLVLAQFGSIYPRKDPAQLLEAGAELVKRGHDVRIVFIGSFIKGQGDVEGEFWAEAERLGVRDRTEVTGYVGTAAELYGLFAEVDAFLYPLSEGLTSRRSSVQAAALSGRPVIVTAPARADALAHNGLLTSLVKSGTIQFVPRDATPGQLADAVLATRGMPMHAVTATREVEALWTHVAEMLDA